MNFLSTTRKRIILFSLLYASEGAPIGFIWWTLPTELRTLGIPIDKITALTSLLVLPWTLKFLWAPLVDVLRTSRWTLRSWILASQFVMGISLFPLLFINFSTSYALAAIFFLLHTIAAATQDVAIDTLCINEVPETERSTINGWMQAGMLFGRALFGGSAIVLTQYLGINTIIIGLMIFILSISAVLVFVQPQQSQQLLNFSEKREAFLQHIQLLLKSKTLWVGLLFAAIGGTAYESVGAVAGPLFVDLGFSKSEIGFFFSVLSIGAMLAGALVGGYAIRVWGLFPVVKLSVAGVGIIVLALAFFMSTHTIIMSMMTLLYFGIGAFTASTYTMFMHITDPKLGATQFSAYMGGTNLCESLSAYFAGMIIAESGYSIAFMLMSTVTILSLLLVRKIEQQ